MAEELGPITVIGAGGIGGIVACFLVRAGERVTIADTSVPHIEAIRSQGLLVDGVCGGHRSMFDNVLFPEELKGPLRFVILSVKSQHTEEALSTLKPLLSEDGVIVSLQNGLNGRRVAQAVGAHRTIAGMVHLVGNYLGPGHVRRYKEGQLYIGEVDGKQTARASEIARRLSQAVPTHAAGNIWGYVWAKLCHSCANTGTVLVDAPASEVYKPEWAKRIFLALMGEVVEVAQAEGVQVEAYDRFEPRLALVRRKEDLARALETVPAGSAKDYSGIWLDIKVRGRKSEIEYLSGEVIRLGRAHGLPMTINSQVFRMVQEIENGQRSMSWDNLRSLEKYANDRLPR